MPSNLQGDTPHILLVEDEKVLARINARRLENFGYRVTSCTGSPKALEAVRATPAAFDLLITDQSMPGLTGLELIAQVREIAPSLPVILSTGQIVADLQDMIQSVGIDALVPKPILGDALVQAVRSVLDAARRSMNTSETI